MSAIDNIRVPGNASRVGLIIDQPATIYSARAAGGVDLSDYSIPFDTPSGTLSNCKPDMTLLIGSAAGGWDLGQARLRKDPVSGTFYIGADKSLNVQGGDYLTVIAEYNLWSKFIVNGLVDVDMAYSSQFSTWKPVPVLGPDGPVLAGTPITFDASLSWSIGYPVASFAWNAPGATEITGGSTATPSITYATPGRYLVSCTITDDNGQTATGYRAVWVIGTGFLPTYNFELGDIVGDLNGKTWSASATLYPDSFALARPGALVCLWAEDWYGNTKASYDYHQARAGVLLTGRIAGNEHGRQPFSDKMSIEILGLKGFMDRMAASALGLQDANFSEDMGDAGALPAWAVINGMTTQKAMAAVAHYRSTLAVCADVTCEEWGYTIPKLAETETLGAQIDGIASLVNMSAGSDRVGRLFVQRPTHLYPVASRAANIPVVFDLTDGDWQQELTIDELAAGDVAGVKYEGNRYSEGKLIQTGAKSPGSVPGRFGGWQSDGDHLFLTQLEANSFAGMAASQANMRFQQVRAILVHNNRLMDVFPRQTIRATIDGELLRFIPRRAVFQYMPENNYLHTSLELVQEGDSWAAEVIEYPGTSGGLIDDGGGENPPPTDPPPVEPPLPPVDPPSEGAFMAVVSTGDETRSTDDFPAETPSWTDENAAVTSIIDAALDLHDANNYFVLESDKLWRTRNLKDPGGADWEVVLDVDDYAGEMPDLHLLRIKMVKLFKGQIYVLTIDAQDADDYGDVYVFRSVDYGNSWTYSLVREDAPVGGKAYTMETQTGSLTATSGTITLTFTRQGDDESTYNPWAMSVKLQRSAPDGIWWGLLADSTTINNAAQGNLDLAGFNVWLGETNHLLDDADQLTAQGWMDDEGVDAGSWTALDKTMPKSSSRVHVKVSYERAMPGTMVTATAVVFWHEPSSGFPYAFDVAPTNGKWIYVGFEDSIYWSQDGGFTWAALVDDQGAYDICVHPLIPSIIVFWDTDGNLCQCIGGAVQAPLLSSTPRKQWGRIAYDPRAVYLYVLDFVGGSYTVKRRMFPDNGGWSSLLTGIAEARHIQAFMGGENQSNRVIFVSQTDIEYSTDGGTSFDLKKGNWSGYGNGVTIHFEPEAE